MGIPSFYRWLVERYPRSIVQAAEGSPIITNGVASPIDTTTPNPNGVEYDNLYLDMNGIIHPCFHPEGLTAPKTNDEVFIAMFKYIDRVFSIIRPRKLLFLAIDGVAPRAKMNQQRSRRFRSAKEVADEVSATEKQEADTNELRGERLDSNVITPGTEFMELLSSALRYYIHLRMNTDPSWQGIKVILSDASVPGEGEHKIVSYIRMQRNLPGFDPNTHHCLYGLDADLIMLALATHEIHFTILREDVHMVMVKDMNSNNGKNGDVQSQSHQGKDFASVFDNFLSKRKFQLLRIWILRDYLAHELRIPDPTVNSDLERLIDDFVFMCLFVGNDFLPHVPSLEIREGAIDLLMTVYKKEFAHMGGYLTNSSEVNLERVGHFIKAVGSHETAIFRKRNQMEKDWESRLKLNRSSSKPSHGETKETTNNVEVNSAIDKVKLGEDGFKERYYAEKFRVHSDDDLDKIRKNAVAEYVEGMCWVMHYYYQGICSWQWFYPYHYAPFASDFEGLDQLEISFTLGKPFKPFDQLMGVLPAASAQALPIHYRKLMSDPSSPILDFYPTEFEVDLNGKRHAWQGVCKLPFIDESRLLAEITKVEHTLTDEEKRRNSLSLDVLYVYKSHPLARKILSFFKKNKDNPKLSKCKLKKKIKPKYSGGMNGFIHISDKPVHPTEIHSPINDMEMISENKVISVFYKLPLFHPHIPRPPEGVILPAKTISKQHICPPAIPWHEKTEIVKRRYHERPMPQKSVSGPYLGKLARQLVSETYVDLTKRQKKDLALKRNIVKQNINGNGEKEGSDSALTKVKLVSEANENGNGKREGSTLTKSQKKNLARKRRKLNQTSCEKLGEESHIIAP